MWRKRRLAGSLAPMETRWAQRHCGGIDLLPDGGGRFRGRWSPTSQGFDVLDRESSSAPLKAGEEPKWCIGVVINATAENVESAAAWIGSHAPDRCQPLRSLAALHCRWGAGVSGLLQLFTWRTPRRRARWPDHSVRRNHGTHQLSRRQSTLPSQLRLTEHPGSERSSRRRRPCALLAPPSSVESFP